MRIILLMLLGSLSLSSFAQTTKYPTVLGGNSEQLSYNLRPDLQVLSIQLGAVTNGRQSLLVKIRNNGSEYAIPSTLWTKFIWKPDYKAEPQFFGTQRNVPGIKPHRSIAIQVVAPPGLILNNNVPLFRDAVTVQIVADFSNQNDESNEQNNQFVQNFDFNN